MADDGLLDVCMVDKINLLHRVLILLKVPKGTHLSHPKVHYYQTKKILIELDHKAAYHLDGELFFDRFVMELVGNPICVAPDRRLRKLSKIKKWLILE